MNQPTQARTLLAVFAHPDDESFGPGGTLARYAHQGFQVHLVCATRGEAGASDLDDLGDCEDLACRRQEELRCAADVLGLTAVHILGYRDSGMAGSDANEHPNALAQADPAFLAGQIAAWICALHPQVVVTFDSFGGYGHPDHVAMHHATRQAFNRVRRGLLPAEEQPQKLYYTVFPRRALRWAVRVLPLLGRDPSAMGKNQDIDLREIAAHETPVTTRIDVRQFYETRQEAGACHSSQLSGPSSIFGWLPKWLVRRLFGTESFYRAFPPFGDSDPLERDLFAGVM